MFKLDIVNDLGISYKWHGFRLKGQRWRLGLTAIRRGFELYECLLVFIWVYGLAVRSVISSRHGEWTSYWLSSCNADDVTTDDLCHVTYVKWCQCQHQFTERVVAEPLMQMTLFHSIMRYTVYLSLIHIWRCRRSTLCRSRWSPYH